MKEWKRLSKKGKAALIALALGGSLCGVSSAEAAVLAVTIPSDYANSQLGYVTGSRVTDHVDQAPVAGYVQGLNRDPGLYRANINGKSVLLLRQYTYSTTDLKPLQVLDVNGDLRKPIASGIIQNADNPHSAASNGDYVFTANYDTGSITGAKIVGDKLQDSSEMMITSERFKRDLDTAWGAGKAPLTYGVDEEVTLHGEGLYMLGNHLFIAYNANPKATGWNEYKDGVLAQYDIEKGNKLVFKGAAKIAKNCDSVSINRYNNHFILNGIGGFQHYGDQMNEESGVSIVTTQPGIGLSNPAKNSRNAVIPKNVQDLRNTNFADFYDTKVTSNGTAYILAYGLGAGNINHLYVFKTTVSNLMAEHPEDWELVLERGESDGWFGRIKYDQYTKRFWAEIGNELSVFKDGASDPSHTWKAKDFSTNEQFSLFNSVVAPDGDTVAGDLAVYHKFVPEGISSYENAKIEGKGMTGKMSEAITGTEKDTKYSKMTSDYKTYTLKRNLKIQRKEGVGDPKTNVYAGIFARDGNDVSIDGSMRFLTLELTNDIGSPVGIYAGNGKNVKLDVKGLIVKGTVNVAPEYGNSITNAIWNDPGVDKASTIEIKGPVKIQLIGGHGGNGLAVMKTDRWGENSFKSDKTSSIIVHGDVTIKNDRADKWWGIMGNLDNVYSRFNNAGILTRVNNSKVIVDGNVDFSVYGNGVTTNAAGSSVQLGGGSIVVPKGMKYGYYTLAAYNGNIYMNTGAEGKTPGTSTVQLDGDIFALPSGKISVALTDKNSYFHGIADNGGEMNLWLQNGAQWINKAQNKRYVHDDEDKGAGEKSHISRLTGGNTISEAGVIFPEDEKDITIDSYSGHTMVVYGHDTANPKKMTGGDTIITKAQAGSGITLRTDNSGLNMESGKAADKNLVSETLNALANKLYYTAYKDGEKNLTGKVEIAEGLTAQSASKRIEDMTFKKENGQGQYLFTPSEDEPPVSDEGPIKKTTTLTKDRTVTWSEVSADNKYVSTLYTEKHTSKQEPMIVDLNGNNLTLNAASANQIAAAVYVGGNEYIDIKNTNKDKKLSITATNTDTRGASAIYLNGNSHLTITGPVSIDKVETKGDSANGINSQGKGNEVLIEGPLTIKNVKGLRGRGKGISASGILLTGDNSKVIVTGPVDISGVEGSGLKTVGADTEISIGGGTITAAKDADRSKNYYAARVEKGTININMKNGKAGDTKTQITGDLYATGQYGKRVVEYSGGQLVDWADAGVLNVALTDKDSFWTGAGVYDSYTSDYGAGGKTVHDIGKFNLHLKNGATWTNERQSHGTTTTVSSAEWTGSILATLAGGEDAAHAGVIIQKESTPIHILDYKGHTTVIYAHDNSNPKNMIGGDTIISKAQAGSEITLRTDNTGLNVTSDKAADKNLVSETLNALANKLYYKAYVNGETNLKGKVEIAEGLTAQSVSKRLEDMTFKKENGQGQYLFTPAEDKPEGQTITEFGKAITGGKDQLYIDSGVKQEDGTYKFTKDSTITIDDAVTGETYPVNTDGGDKVIVHAEGKTLTLNSKGKGLRVGIQTALRNNKKIDITAGKLIVNAETQSGMSRAYGIWMAAKNCGLDVHGDTEITANGNEWSYGILSGQEAKINLEGVKIRVNNAAKESAALAGSAKSTISVNVKNENLPGNKKVDIIGDVITKKEIDDDGYGTITTTGPNSINLALTTKDSVWKGSSVYEDFVEQDDYDEDETITKTHGIFNLWLQNGAQWINERQGKQTFKGYKGSYVSSLKGGDEAGVIIQKDKDSITVDNYSGHTLVLYGHDKTNPKKMIGGDFIINKAETGSEITFRTDNSGLNMGSEKAADKNLVSETLNALANKLYYTAYKDGEKNLKGKVEIAEGLTAQSASKRLEDMTFKKENGQGQYLFTPAEDKPDIPDAQTETTFGKAILGSAERDTLYVNTGVLKDGVYHFTKPETTIKIDGTKDEKENKRDMVLFGPWFSSVQAAISGSVPMYDENGNKAAYDAKTVVANSVEIDMHGNKLNVDVKYTGGAGQTGISAIAPMNRVEGAGKVNIKNAGAMNVTVKGSGMTAGLFADGGGKLHIYNGGEDLEGKVLTIRAGSKSKNSGVGIKTMNGNIKAESGVNKHSEITIDGLVDVIADGKADAEGYASNEAVSAVASDINIGGGSIKAINGAWAAIRAYGEFTTPNYGIVNVNAANRVYTNEEGTAMGGKVQVHKVSDFEIGDNKAVIEGDIVTNGGMGTKGQVNIGLKDKDSHWIGNYADTAGYGVTKGSFGAVNIKMKDGAYWKGFGNGSMNIQMTGKDTYWLGFSLQDKMQLTLKDGATWYNAITPEQKDQKGNPSTAKIGYLTSDKGVINMLGETTFTASSESLSGRTTADNPSGIVENKDGITGNVVVDNYKGNATVIYKHDKTDPKKMIGGDFTINKAEKDSMITLRTDNDGMNALSGKKEERNKVSEILNALANKLYYTAYKDGEQNLKGKVEIAEGLTAQSASYRLEDMTFKKENGQGQYLFTPATEDKPDTPKPGEDPKPPTPDKPEPPVIYGPKQTAMMRGAKSAMTTTMLSMRDNMTTMTQRLGDIHEGTEDGIWARTYGGKANYDKDQTKTKENFWGVQIGADKKQKSGWHTGISFDYKDGNATYELGGKGDPKLYTLGIYGTKVKDNGEYIDVVAKAGRGQNDYTVYNDMGHKLKGDYKANAMGLSVEYGKRIEKGDKYLTPQIQLSYMKLQGTDYDAISDYAGGKRMHVKQDGMTSLVGRIGIAAGKRTDKTDLYLKANLLHEFKGTTASTFSAENEPTATVDQDFGDTWAEISIGVNHNIDKDKMVYADITRSFGGDYEMEWKANAGIRLRF